VNQARRARIVAARRTAVCPRGGALAGFQADELAAPVIARLLADADVAPDRVDQVLLGNALYGGGNPARLAALRAGLPPSVPALTIDTQCCSGLDAILHGARLIESGAAECVIAGGAESFSRAPVRMARPQVPGETPQAYDRPPFAPPPFDDPDLAEAAARLAAARNVPRRDQAAYAVASHARAMAARDTLAPLLIGGCDGWPVRDAFTRKLTLKTALRAPLLAGAEDTGLSASTIACEADGAALVLMVPEEAGSVPAEPAVTVRAGVSAGGDPSDPALVPIEAAGRLFAEAGIKPGDLAAVELMEAYAVQAMVTSEALGLDPARANVLGGALARGHPIGASGAILAVNLFERLKAPETPAEGGRALGLALIAAAGGLGTALLLERGVRKGG